MTAESFFENGLNIHGPEVLILVIFAFSITKAGRLAGVTQYPVFILWQNLRPR